MRNHIAFRCHLFSGMIALGALALPGSAFAQDAAIRASTVVGMEVRNTATGASGRIRDLVIDIANNRVHYAELDMPGRMFAAAPAQLRISAQGAVFTPGDRSIDARAGMALVRASTLIGWEVTSEPGERVGRIVDLAIDAASGRVPFAVLRLDRPAGGAPLRAVPTDAFALYALRESLVLTMDRSRVEAAQGFTLAQLEAGLSDARFLRTAAVGATRANDKGALFQRLDRNGDSYLSDAELDRAFPGKATDWMAIDGDRDGRISRSEFIVVEDADASAAAGSARRANDNAALFERLDRDRDGYLSDAEVDRPIAETRNWMAVDLDRDGRISRSEFTPLRP
jgi:sporulation protein YlmC with PRC-barrel domain/Ca2+-binding EF-hand superfamily protein